MNGSICSSTITLPVLSALLAALLSAQEARAIESPRQLAAYCETLDASTRKKDRRVQIPNTKETLLCWGYMQAMQDLANLADESGKRFIGSCPPEQDTLLELIHAFRAYAASHPSELRGNTAVAVIRALQQSYPCPETTTPGPAGGRSRPR
jgi:hypothetical protein